MFLSGSKTGTQTFAPLANGIVNNALFHSSPTRQPDAVLNCSYPAPLSDRLVAELCPNFVFNWFEVMVVRWPQIWRDERMAVGFIQLLRITGDCSDISHQDRGVWYTLRRTERDPSVSISGTLNGGVMDHLVG